MSRLRKILRKSRATLGLQVALAMMVPAKGKAGSDVKEKVDPNSEPANPHASQSAPPHLTGRWDFGRLFAVAAQPDIVKDARESANAAERIARNAVRLVSRVARATHTANGKKTETGQFVPKPMSHEEIRLWLQSFNAGPYACLKYKGDVPYKETRDYVPRVLRAYEQDLPDTYDAAVNKSAAKYGLDPQMVKAIMKTESDFKEKTVSHAGARGLMQVMPVVWSEIREKYELDWDYSSEVFEPEKNIEVACAYLAWLRYDFLPRHFEAYERNPAAPVVLIRDRDRGVPDRATPRIVAKSAAGEAAAIEIASAASEELNKPDSAIVKSKDTAKNSPAKENPRVEITDADSKSIVKKSISGGTTRVVVKPGKANTVSISFGKSVKVPASVRQAKSDGEELKRKKPAVARAEPRKEKDAESQGG